MKIIGYMLVKGLADDMSEKVVQEMISGWQPFGNLFMDKNGWLIQTMVKYEAEPCGKNLTTATGGP